MDTTTRIIAELWWCGDPVCDCTQPIIEEVTPVTNDIGIRWFRRNRIWEGSFHSQASREELEAQWKELTEAAEKYHAEIVGTPPLAQRGEERRREEG